MRDFFNFSYFIFPEAVGQKQEKEVIIDDVRAKIEIRMALFEQLCNFTWFPACTRLGFFDLFDYVVRL